MDEGRGRGHLGAAFPFTRPALAEVPPATFTALRFLVIRLVMVPLALLAQRRATGRLAAPERGRVDRPRRGADRPELGAGPESEQRHPLIAATQAVWIVALGALFLRDLVAPRGGAGLVCCLLGVLSVAGVSPFASGGAGDAGWQRGGRSDLPARLDLLGGVQPFA